MFEMHQNRESRGDRIFSTINHSLLVLITLVCFYPLIYVLSASISDPILVNTGEVTLLPKGFTLEGYKMIFEYTMIWIGYRNTIFYTLTGTLINLTITLMTAYALSRKDLIGRNLFTMFFAFTMYFSGGLIPTFLIVKQLGMVNTIWSMLLLGAVSMYNVIITRTYMSNSIPYELQEAAFLDGCSDAGIFTKVILPLSPPIIAVMSLYYAVGHWNSYFNALIYLTNRNIMPLQIFLREILILNQMTDMMEGADTDTMILLAERQRMAMIMKYCLIVVASAPVLAAYPFVQKYFIKGIMIGAVKG